jgi:hypothetical protein
MVAAEGALTTMEERGKAVGFSEAKENEGVGPVGVGNRETEPLTLAMEPVAPTGAAAEEAEEAAEALMVGETELAI